MRPWNDLSSWLGPILLAMLAGIPLVLLAAFLFVQSGIYDVGAASPHTKLTEWLTHETMIHSMKRHSERIEAPASFTSDQVTAGFCAYERHCVACHGAAAVARAKWASGMEPAPPYLLDIHQRFSRAQLFWIVRNGIKMTGMPAWKNEMSDAETWSVVAWLEASAKLAPQTYVRWRGMGRCSR